MMLFTSMGSKLYLKLQESLVDIPIRYPPAMNMASLRLPHYFNHRGIMADKLMEYKF